jgi:large subunit ribosomal protein L10
MNDTKLSANKQKKGTIIAEITAKVQKAKGFVFTNYQGLTHQQLETIKRAMKKLDAEYVATKNTLLFRAMESYREKMEDSLHGPTATLFIYNDSVEPLKELSKSIKLLNLPIIKLGIIDGNILDASQIDRLSKLPAVNVLRAQLLGQLQSPISGLHRALNWNLQKLVLTLNAVKGKKSVA